MPFPVYLTRLVGREVELDSIDRFLATDRLVSLVGAGGAGKTRLAVEAARRAVGRFSDGAVFVSLADVGVGSSLAAAVAVGARADVQSTESPLEALLELFDAERVLLVLDNLEHVVSDAAALVTELLAAERLTILTTSREPLGIPGEVIVRVDPLAQPAMGATPVEALAAASVQLLIDRLRAAAPQLLLSDEDIGELVAIARLVEGLPLALELAAARAGTVGLRELVRVARSSPGALATTSAGVVERHRSVQEALEWSLQLVGAPARDLAERCGMLTSGGSLELLAALVGRPATEVLSVVDELVRASILHVEQRGRRAARYRLLEPIRQLQAEQLAAHHQQRVVMTVILRYCVDLVRQAEPGEGTQSGGEVLVRLGDEYPNAIAALRAAIAANEVNDEVIDLTHGLWLVSDLIIPSELSELYRQVLATPGGSHTRRSALARRAAILLSELGHHDEALTMIRSAIELAREADDAVALASAQEAWAGCLLVRGQLDEAERQLNDCADVLLNEGPQWVRGQIHYHAAAIARYRGAYDVAIERAERQRAIGQQHEIQGGLAAIQLAELYTLLGRWAEALALTDEVKSLASRRSDAHILAEAAFVAFDAHLGRGTLSLAIEALAEQDDIDHPPLWHAVEDRARRARAAVLDGDLTAASIASDDALTNARTLAKPEYISRALEIAAQVAFALDDIDRAGAYLREAVGIAGSVPYASILANILDGLVIEAGRAGDRPRARTIGAAVQHLRAVTGSVRLMLMPYRDELRPVLESVAPSSDLFETDSARLTQQGQAMLTAAPDARVVRRNRPRAGWDSLTPAELAVARLVAQGLRSRQIADKLHISNRTVDAHLAHTFTKLNLTTRTQLAAEVLRRPVN